MLVMTLNIWETTGGPRDTRFLHMLDILFLSNHNIHKSSCGLYFWASDPLIERF